MKKLLECRIAEAKQGSAMQMETKTPDNKEETEK